MNQTNAMRTHSLVRSPPPRTILQDGRTLLHHRCSRCERDSLPGGSDLRFHSALAIAEGSLTGPIDEKAQPLLRASGSGGRETWPTKSGKRTSNGEKI
jgi:hypothetical protein